MKALTAAAGLVLACAAAGPAAASAGPAVLAFHPAPFDYGPLPVGLLAARTFTLANTGDRASSALTVRLSGSAAFKIIADGCTGKSLGPGKQCTVRVQFWPTQDGRVTATLQAVSKNRAATATGALAGTGGRKGSGTGQTCTTYVEPILPVGGYQICFRVQGQGLYVQSFDAWWVNNSLLQVDQAHLEIVGPSGHIENCPDEVVPGWGYQPPDCFKAMYANVPDGMYCAKLWVYGSPVGIISKPHWFQLGYTTCVHVHA